MPDSDPSPPAGDSQAHPKACVAPLTQVLARLLARRWLAAQRENRVNPEPEVGARRCQRTSPRPALPEAQIDPASGSE